MLYYVMMLHMCTYAASLQVPARTTRSASKALASHVDSVSRIESFGLRGREISSAKLEAWVASSEDEFRNSNFYDPACVGPHCTYQAAPSSRYDDSY